VAGSSVVIVGSEKPAATFGDLARYPLTTHKYRSADFDHLGYPAYILYTNE
jgi:hypothetical protein